MRSTTVVAGAGVLWLVLTCGNALAAWSGSLPEPRPLGRDLPTVQADTETPKIAVPSGELTLRQALALALLGNPELAAYSWEVRAREAETLQAGLLPNPELAVELENFAGSGGFSGTAAAETTVTLSQLVELGSKRAKRRADASLEANLAGWDFEAQRLDVLTATARSFVAVLAAQQRLAQAEELSNLAQSVFRTVRERVEAGKVSPVEQSRAQVPLAETRIALNQARRDLQAYRLELAALWGADAAAFSRAEGLLEEVAPVPSEARLTALLEQNPALARWQTEQRQRSARLALARAGAIPDVTLYLGGRHFQEAGDNAFVAGLAIPLPLFDRNQGAVAAARAASSKALENGRSARDRLRAALASGYRDLSAAYVAVQTLKQEILPAAKDSFEAINLGYREGKFGFLEVLDAQRTLSKAKGKYLDALLAWHLARIKVERLIGAPLPAPAAAADTPLPTFEVKR